MATVLMFVKLIHPMQQEMTTVSDDAVAAGGGIAPVDRVVAPVEEVTPPLDWLFESNPIMAWSIVIAGLLILVTIAYYAIEYFRQSINDDPASATSEKLSELEQLKSTAYMTDEEKRRLNAASPIAALAKDGEVDPELAVFRKIKQQRMSNQNSEKESMFNELEDNPDG